MEAEVIELVLERLGRMRTVEEVDQHLRRELDGDPDPDLIDLLLDRRLAIARGTQLEDALQAA